MRARARACVCLCVFTYRYRPAHPHASPHHPLPNTTAMFRLVDEAHVRGSSSAALDGRGDGGWTGACSFVGDAVEVIGRVRVGETVSLAPDAEYLVRIDQPSWSVEKDANEDAKRDVGRVGLKASSSLGARDDPLNFDQGRSEGARSLVGDGGQQDCAGDVCAERGAEGRVEGGRGGPGKAVGEREGRASEAAGGAIGAPERRPGEGQPLAGQAGAEDVWGMTQKELGQVLDQDTALYHAKILASRDQLQALMDADRHLDIWRLGVALKRQADAQQEASEARACRRCVRCRTCQGIPSSALDGIDINLLPFAYDYELFEPGEWQDRTAVLSPARNEMLHPRVPDGLREGAQGWMRGRGSGEDVTITFLAPRFGDVMTEAGTSISVVIDGYDFDSLGGYAVLTAGGHQVMAFQESRLETALMGTRGHVPQMVSVALVANNGRPLGISNSVVYWETWMPDPPRLGPKSSINATRIHRAPWRAGRPLPLLGAAASVRHAARVDGAVGAGGKGVGVYPAPTARSPKGQRVSFVLTSCVAVGGRLTLLEETIESFLSSNTYPIDRYILIDDSGDTQVHKRLVALFGDVFDVMVNVQARTGMTFSIDAAYSLVDSDYIFHCQDDWLFHTRGNFVGQSIDILTHRPDIMVVWCRDHDDHQLPLGEEEQTPTGVPFRLVLPLTQWKGFTFNPGLRRVSDYRVMAPMQRYWFEDYVQGYMRWMGQYGASLVDGWTYHTGEHHSTKPSYQAANEELAKAHSKMA